jgi:hypothetical protein
MVLHIILHSEHPLIGKTRYLLTGASQAIFFDEIGRFFRKRSADDFFTNDNVWRYVGYAGIAFGAVILATAYL